MNPSDASPINNIGLCASEVESTNLLSNERLHLIPNKPNDYPCIVTADAKFVQSKLPKSCQGPCLERFAFIQESQIKPLHQFNP